MDIYLKFVEINYTFILTILCKNSKLNEFWILSIWTRTPFQIGAIPALMKFNFSFILNVCLFSFWSRLFSRLVDYTFVFSCIAHLHLFAIHASNTSLYIRLVNSAYPIGWAGVIVNRICWKGGGVSITRCHSMTLTYPYHWNTFFILFYLIWIILLVIEIMWSFSLCCVFRYCVI